MSVSVNYQRSSGTKMNHLQVQFYYIDVEVDIYISYPRCIEMIYMCAIVCIILGERVCERVRWPDYIQL